MSIEFHTSDDWTAVYEDGRLVTVGDTYLAEEWLHQKFDVVDVDDDAFLRGQWHREGVAQTLAEVRAYAEERQSRRERAAQLRAEASKLEYAARKLETAG